MDLNKICVWFQCSGFVIIIPNPAGGNKFLEFRIRILPMLFKHICNFKKVKKKHLIIDQTEESVNYLPLSISHYSLTVPQSRIQRPKFLNLEIKF